MTKQQVKFAAISTIALTCLAMTTIAAQPAHAENQPHMERAIVLLIEARAQLRRASYDKGGHRAKAISQINKALTEVRKGIRFDNRK